MDGVSTGATGSSDDTSGSHDLARVGLASAAAGVAIEAFSFVSSVLAALVFLAVLVAAFVIFLRGLVPWLQNLHPRPPAPPVVGQAKLPSLPREPATTIQDLASHCVICGRPLTTWESMRARVGSTCIRTYGPRPRMIPNPDHERWRGLLAAAEVERAAEQARLNVAHQHALAVHAELMRVWEHERQSPAAVERQAVRHAASRRMLRSVVVAVSTFLGLVVTATVAAMP